MAWPHAGHDQRPCLARETHPDLLARKRQCDHQDTLVMNGLIPKKRTQEDLVIEVIRGNAPRAMTDKEIAAACDEVDSSWSDAQDGYGKVCIIHRIVNSRDRNQPIVKVAGRPARWRYALPGETTWFKARLLSGR
jgi:hypothetical protein